MSKDLKPYPKYQYQIPSERSKSTEREAFLSTINGPLSEHLYALNPLGKKGRCFFYLKKSTLGPFKEQELTDSNFKITFKLDSSNLIEVLKLNQSKQKRFQGKQTK
jgi:hypothetical protein